MVDLKLAKESIVFGIVMGVLWLVISIFTHSVTFAVLVTGSVIGCVMYRNMKETGFGVNAA
jgi:predicted phage tail protein